MQTLYELTNEYMMLLEMAEDPDVDPQAFEDTLEGFFVIFNRTFSHNGIFYSKSIIIWS